MPARMNIAFFGSSLVSAYWNGAATYYRGLLRALAALGYRITFYEPDAYDRQAHRDIPDPDWARSVVYSAHGDEGVKRALEAARSADLIVKASGVGVFDAYLEQTVLELRSPHNLVAFWDVDAPATLERVQSSQQEPFRALIPGYDVIFTYGGGKPVVDAYRKLGARSCVPIYNALDPTTHHPAPLDARFSGDLGLVANRLPDREARIDALFLEVARMLPRRQMVLAGSGWQDKALPENVRYAGHLYTRDHNAFNCSPTAVMNVTRDSMTRFGFSPATRVFEAAGAGACIISDVWEGVEQFLEPDRELLLAKQGLDVAALLENLTRARANEIGARARRRILAEHTYARRAAQVMSVLEGMSMPGAERRASSIATQRATSEVRS